MTRPNFEKEIITIKIHGGLELEQIVLKSAKCIAKRMNFSIPKTEDLKTVVNEAYLNAVEHGQKDQKDSPICIQYELKQDVLKVDILDQGIGFDPKQFKKLTVHEKIEEGHSYRGWDLFLIRGLSDHFETIRGTLGEYGIRISFSKSNKASVLLNQ